MTPEQLTGPRSASWRFDLYGLSDFRPLGSLDGVTRGEFDYSIFSTIRSGGSLTWDRVTEPPEWDRVLVQPVYRVGFYDGTTAEWPVGTFIPATPVEGVRGPRRTYKVDLYDQLLLLDEDAFIETAAYDAGTVITDAVKALLAASGRPRYVVVDSALTLSGPMVWEAGTSRLRVINDLLDAAGYFSIWADPRGTLRASPYLPPASRGIAWSFADGDSAIYTPDFDHERDTFGAPNRVLLVARSADGDTPPLTSTATLDPEHPLSYESRGNRWVTRRYDVEAASQAVLDGMADRYLADASNVGSLVEIKHLPLPLDTVDLNSLVTFTHSATGARVNGVVQKFKIGTETPSLVSTTIREVRV